MGDSQARRKGARRVVVALALVGGVLLVLVGAAWLFQRSLIYYPDTAAPPPADTVIDGAVDVTLTTEDGLELGAWFVPSDRREADPVRRDFAVLVAPGNGGNREGRAGLARALRERGFAVLLVDYRGYGGNPGSPTEQGLAYDARAAQAHLAERGFSPEQTIYFGESLGSGVVARLQQDVPPAGVVLRSPFTSLVDAGAHHFPYLPVRLLLRDRFPVAETFAESDVPLTVVHGDRDSVVPSAQSAEVADAARNLVEHYVIRGADHNDAVMFGPRVADAVARLADEVSGAD